MIYNSITKQFKTQNWKEHFQVFISAILVQDLKEGLTLPRFYLPVAKPTYKLAYECWIIPLAPFVLFYRILTNALYCIWRDLIDLQRMLMIWASTKRKT